MSSWHFLLEGDPKLQDDAAQLKALLADEPTTGLDPVRCIWFRKSGFLQGKKGIIKSAGLLAMSQQLCIYLYIRTCIRTYVRTYIIYIHNHKYIHSYIHTYMFLHTILMYIYKDIYIYTHTHAYTYVFICVYTGRSLPLEPQDTFQAAEMVQLLAELGQSRQCATIMCLGSLWYIQPYPMVETNQVFFVDTQIDTRWSSPL